MRILILGGTAFLGRHTVEAARAHGHAITLFNRGRRNPGLFPDLVTIRGDRDGGLEALRRQRWDAVLDTSGYVPRLVRASAEALAGAVEHYVFISTLSVYAQPLPAGTDESGLVAQMPPEQAGTEAITPDTYGALKALCERAVEQALPGRVLIVRPGLIVGPHDPTDRFTYWPVRIARGGEVLAPGRPEQPVQFIDVRDLAQWLVHLIEQRQAGVFNATGPRQRLAMGDFLAECCAVTGSDARLAWVSEAFLLAHQVAPFSDLPLWVPEADLGFNAFRSERAYAAGLSLRPVADTVRATLDWARGRPADHEWRAGLAPQREAELLAEWNKQ